jgi:hypothetical protein
MVEKKRGSASLRLTGSGKSHPMTGSSSKARPRAPARRSTSAVCAFLRDGFGTVVTPKYDADLGTAAGPFLDRAVKRNPAFS